MTHPMQDFWAPGWTPEMEAKEPLPEKPYAAPGRDMPLPFGVDYVGPFETLYDGVNLAVRRHARALNDAGVPVFLQSAGHSMMVGGRPTSARFADLPEELQAEVKDITTCRHRESLLKIRHIILHGASVQNVVFPGNMQWADEEYIRRSRETTVVNTVFERITADSGVQDCAKALSKIAEVWVPCTRNRDVLLAAGMPPEKVWVIPHPYDPTELPVFERYQQAKPTSNVCRFLNVGKWEPRKAQHELIGAFMLAFKPGDPVQLIMKTSAFGKWKGYPRNVPQSVTLWLEEPTVKQNGWTMPMVQKKILPYTDSLPREMLIAMHCQSDFYVAAGRGEGFDFPAFDARLAGLRLVYVPAGGSEDYAGESDIRVNAAKPYGPVHEGYGWTGAEWSGYTVKEMAAALQAAKVAWSCRAAAFARQGLLDYSPVAVGKKMRQRCEAVVAGIRARGEAHAEKR